MSPLRRTTGGLIGFGEWITNYLEGSYCVTVYLTCPCCSLTYFRHPLSFCIISNRNTTMDNICLRPSEFAKTVSVCRLQKPVIRRLVLIRGGYPRTGPERFETPIKHPLTRHPPVPLALNLVGCTFRRPQPSGCRVPLPCRMYHSRTYFPWRRVHAGLCFVLSPSMQSRSGASGCVQHSPQGVCFLNLFASRLHHWHIWRGPKHLSSSMVTTSP